MCTDEPDALKMLLGHWGRAQARAVRVRVPEVLHFSQPANPAGCMSCEFNACTLHWMHELAIDNIRIYRVTQLLRVHVNRLQHLLFLAIYTAESILLSSLLSFNFIFCSIDFHFIQLMDWSFGWEIPIFHVSSTLVNDGGQGKGSHFLFPAG